MSDALSGIEKYNITKSMMNEYLDIMQRMDSESAEEIEILKQDTTLDFTAATMYNWYKSAIGYAIKSSNEAMITQLSSNYREAKNAIDLDDISKEISGLYNCAFEFKKAELDLESIAKMSNEPFDEGSMTKMQSNIDRFSSSIKYAITRSFGMLTSTAKYLKNNVIELKNISKNFTRHFVH
jgi:hypothetical protein